jgi:hypothetical protein
MNTRKLLEQYVVAWNKYLKNTVQNMDLITLLRNAHPIYRPDFARVLMNEKQISKDEAREFNILIGR